MRPLAISWPLLLLACSCSSGASNPQPPTNDMFNPVSMNLTTFSKMENWSGGGLPEGVEAVVEFEDQFGDRTKAVGVLLFELYTYRPGWPDPRGVRVVNPWRAPLENVDQQQAHWERATAAYAFRLAYDQLHIDQNYVLAATFQSPEGKRFFSQIVIPALIKPESKYEHHRPTTASQPSPGRRFLGQ